MYRRFVITTYIRQNTVERLREIVMLLIKAMFSGERQSVLGINTKYT
jgi:hypothetical protein